MNAWNTAFLDTLVKQTNADLSVVNGYRFGFVVSPGRSTLDDCDSAFLMMPPIATDDVYGDHWAVDRRISKHIFWVVE